jgi:hypothetical protein
MPQQVRKPIGCYGILKEAQCSITTPTFAPARLNKNQ